MYHKIRAEEDSNFNIPVILTDKNIEDAGLTEDNKGEPILILMTLPSEEGCDEGVELRITYEEIKEILERMEELM